MVGLIVMSGVNNRTLFFFLGFLVTEFVAGPATAQRLDIYGYGKSYLQMYNPPQVTHDGEEVDESIETQLSNRLRLTLRARLHDEVLLTVAYDLAPQVFFEGEDPTAPSFAGGGRPMQVYRAEDLNREMWLSKHEHVGLYHNLDRLLVAWSLPAADIYVGRQAIAWGSARVVNPTDILAPFAYGELDTEDRRGVDALRMRMPIGMMGELDAGVAFGEDFTTDNRAWFLRGRHFFQRIEMTGTVAHFQGNLLLGLDLTRALGGASSWLEAAYVIVDDDSRSFENDYWRISLGADYGLTNGTYLFVEYHYNEPGVGNPSEYQDLLTTIPYREGAVYLLGEHYLIPGINHPITPLINLNLESLINLDVDDPSVYLFLQTEYNFKTNWYLSGGLYKGFGAGLSAETSPCFHQPMPNSEFGSYADLFFLSIWNYF